MTKIKRNSNKARNNRIKARSKIQSYRKDIQQHQDIILDTAVRSMNRGNVEEWASFAAMSSGEFENYFDDIFLEEAFKLKSFEAKRDVLALLIASPEYLVDFDLDRRAITISRLRKEVKPKVKRVVPEFVSCDLDTCPPISDYE